MTEFHLDKVRAYAILDAAFLAPEAFLPCAQALVGEGIKLLQYRAKGQNEAFHKTILDDLYPFICDSSANLIINDQLKLAMDYPGLGLHLGQDDLDPRQARQQLGEGPAIGLSTHSIEQAKAALNLTDYIDYIAVGPIFPTAQKPEYGCVGLDLLNKVRALGPKLPVFAIGGIDAENARSVLDAGADGVVCISGLLESQQWSLAARKLVEAMDPSVS